MKRWIYIYRYDLIAAGAILLIVLLFLAPIYGRGQIVFSDLAFGGRSDRYMEEIVGVWNERWSTSTLLNAPRLLYILPFYGLSLVFGGSGAVLLKSFVTCLLLVSALSMYLFTKRLAVVYYSDSGDFTLIRMMALLPGALFYALNPWVVFRIQHIYLLCGYSLFPLVLMLFFSAFDPKFQRRRIENYDVRRLYRRNVVDLFLLAIVFTISAAAIHYFFYGLIYLGMFAVLLAIKQGWVYRRSGWSVLKKLYRNFLLKGVIFGLFFGLLSFYWLSLYFGSILMDAQVSQNNINVVDTLSLFSRNSSLVNVLYFISYWWPMFPLERLPLSFYVGGGVLLALIALSMLTASRRFSIILMFTLLTFAFALVATGVKIPLLAKAFVLLVTKTPIVGTMFRDPNKIVGLLAVNFSVLLSFGVIRALAWLKPPGCSRVVKAAAVLAVLGCLWIYVNPLREEFIKGYYMPVQIPAEYGELAAKLTDAKQTNPKQTDPKQTDAKQLGSKVLYFPIADNMIQSYNGVATPVWNQGNTFMEKATGDFQVYSSPKNTLFHHEGNAPSITYYFNFLQYLLDNGLSGKLGKLFAPFGIDQLVYHQEYAGQEERQAFNQELLKMQAGLDNTYNNRYFSLYRLENALPYMYVVPRKVVTPYGFSRMESYSHQPGFDFSNFAVLFTGLTPSLPILPAVNQGDYLEAASFDDLLLSQLPAEYYLRPFDAIEDGNAYLKWSKTLVSNNDWLWYLASQNIGNYPFDMDLNAGTAVTFATSKLDVAPYMMDRVKGKTVLDLNGMLSENRFFTADNPDLFKIEAASSSSAERLPKLYGEIMKGEPKNIWQVAKSGLLEAKENNPYQFSITASGKGTNQLHFKVRFYDENKNELGIHYVVAPTTESDFDGARFYGEFITPPGTTRMRIDLLTRQRPEQNTYWRIHAIELADLGAYKKPNTFVMHKTMDKQQLARIYARVLVNKAGGSIRVALPDGTVDVPTKDGSINQFQWVDLGQQLLPQGEVNVSVTNVQGFNAVNMLAIVPDEKREDLALPVERAIKRAKLFLALEAEQDFAGSGNVQSERTYPKLSMGRGISYQDGELRRTVEILRDGDYSAALLANLPSGHRGKLTVTLTNQASGEVIKRTVQAAGSSILRTEDTVIETDRLRETFTKKLLRLPAVLADYRRHEIRNLHLAKGTYTLSIVFDSSVPSLSSPADFQAPEQASVQAAAAAADAPSNAPSNAPTNAPSDAPSDAPVHAEEACVRLPLGRSELKTVADQLEIRYSPSASCAWYTYESGLMSAEANGEYLVSFDAVSENAPGRHLKVVFFNDQDEVIATSYVDEVEESYKNKWNHYEQIFTAPEGAAGMRIQVLAKGDRREKGFFRMKNYSVIPYKDMILLDQFILFEGDGSAPFFTSPPHPPEVTVQRIDAMSRRFTLHNPQHEQVLINESESPHPLWELELDGEKQRARIAVNGVTTGFITSGSGSGRIVVILRRFYQIGIVLLVLSLSVGAVCIFALGRLFFHENYQQGQRRFFS
ncbi:hypothetical protein LMZ02_12205 [Paenibacillus macerans]|uniref:hypothetical protein n=1 Tax=Paenibacillus macerans TaxID=44252 RepID=UPI001F104C18|nr:hypothetical protein [Paenibacillus macerans]UMV50063.1 hypothetical protein LMZ02_12205 [Paenibacillus macerans]